MRHYLIKMRPLEPYTFGREQGYKGFKREQTTYFIRSNDMPEQTTVLGMLRYFVLKRKHCLREDFCYTAEEIKENRKWIGAESFGFSKPKQNFGILKSISPVFLINEKNQYLIRAPFCMKGEEKIRFMEMGDPIFTSAGEIQLPKEKEYDPKKGYERNFFNLHEKHIEKELIEEKFYTGNRKNNSRNPKDQEDGFFKQEVKFLNKEIQFAVFAEVDGELPKQEICTMGLKRAAFLVTAEQVEKNDLEEKIVEAFHGCGGNWVYAYSDLVVEQKLEYSSFCIVEEKQIRNLETCYSGKGYGNKIKRNNVQYNLIKAGSVFWNECCLDLDNENCRQIGYNHVVRIGGDK